MQWSVLKAHSIINGITSFSDLLMNYYFPMPTKSTAYKLDMSKLGDVALDGNDTALAIDANFSVVILNL